VVCVPTIVITSTIVALKVRTQTSRTVLQFYAPIANETKRPVFIISFSLVFCYVIMVQPNDPPPPLQRAQHSLSHFHHHRQRQRHNQHSSSIAANGQKSTSRRHNHPNAMIPTAVDWERRMNHRQAIQATNEWRFGIVICYVAGRAQCQ
jgi:hypothetical protein